jgi:hypothetical protein
MYGLLPDGQKDRLKAVFLRASRPKERAIKGKAAHTRSDHRQYDLHHL